MPIRLSRRSGMALLGVVSASSLALSACGSSGSSTSSGPVTITVAVVANPLMTTIEQLTPGVAAGGGQYDVLMIGPNDIGAWSKNKWIDPLTSYANSDPSYDASDILKPIRDALSSNGTLYAVPFYGESSFMMYNKQMFKAAHVTMPANPTWTQVATLAAKLDNPSKGVAGICLRGKTGWGENLAALDTVVNTFGGQWFDTQWNAHLTSPAFEQATNFYVNLVRKYGEKGAGNDSFNECLNIMEQKRAAMWYDATVAASTLDAKPSPIAGNMGFAPAPVMKTQSSGWLWSWALALESASKNKSAAWKFMDWATSKQYIAYDAAKNGWASVPPGTRTSTYQNPKYLAAAKDFAPLTLQVLNSVNVKQPGLAPQPVPGIQYVGIPQFESFGQQVSAEITAAIDGQESVATALSKSQQIAQQAVNSAGLKTGG